MKNLVHFVDHQAEALVKKVEEQNPKLALLVENVINNHKHIIDILLSEIELLQSENNI